MRYLIALENAQRNMKLGSFDWKETPLKRKIYIQYFSKLWANVQHDTTMECAKKNKRGREVADNNTNDNSNNGNNNGGNLYSAHLPHMEAQGAL